MAKERKSFLLRVDPRIHDALRRWSEDEFRSLNAQVEMMLRDALRKAGRLKGEEDEASKELPQVVDSDPDHPKDQEE
ncbi:MAG: type II toxin-antitoxin system antitoxin, partial [Planctomycetota bacterium]|jgi:hypothetical protein